MRNRTFDRRWVADANGCHLWLGSLDRDGYGRYSGKAAHRLAWEPVHGPVPAGLQLDHLCRVRRCVNPAHLELVTARENLLRSPWTLASINAAKEECPSGHPYSEANTYRYPQGTRSCRICRQERAKARREALSSLRLVKLVVVYEQQELFDMPSSPTVGERHAA